jgi:hypothetical protein
MKIRALFCLGVVIGGSAEAASLLVNGNLDRTYAQEIVPAFFLPKPSNWVNEGSRAISGPYEDEMSSEPWAGPAPTPVTTDGLLNGPPPAGFDGPDGAVFFKAFSGNATDGAATGHLYQDVAASAGLIYTLTGWAGAELNYLANRSELALEFLNGSGAILGTVTLDLVAAGLLTPNGQAFNYKQYTVSGTAPANTATVRSRVSMIGGTANPAGGGQAFVVDDFELNVVPEPSIAALILLAGTALVGRRSKV